MHCRCVGVVRGWSLTLINNECIGGLHRRGVSSQHGEGDTVVSRSVEGVGNDGYACVFLAVTVIKRPPIDETLHHISVVLCGFGRLKDQQYSSGY